MKQQNSTSEVLQITDPQVAKSIIDGTKQRYLHPFVDRETNLKDAAQTLGITIDSLFYWVQKWLDFGILTVSRTEPRAGRPIKYYRTTSKKIFIHVSATNSGLVLEMMRNTREHYDRLFTTNVAHAIKERDEIGIVISRSAEGEVECKLGESDGLPANEAQEFVTLDFFVPNVHLDAKNAQTFRQELSDLVQKYISAKSGKPHMLHIGVTPISTSEPE